MDERKNNIRIIFTDKADVALDNIIESFNLEETPKEKIKKRDRKRFTNIVIIDYLTKDFAKGNISEKELVVSLQNNLEVSQQTAQQISKEIISRIVPFLEKVPEEKLQDPIFVAQLEKRIFGENTEIRQFTKETRASDIFPGIKPLIGGATIVETEEKIPSPSKRTAKSNLQIKKSVIPETGTQQPKQPSGPDSYREPIE